MTQPFARTMRNAVLQVTLTGQFETLDLGGGLHAYKVLTQVSHAKREGSGYAMALPQAETTTSQGVIDDANLAKALAGEPYKASRLILAEDALIEHLRLWGFQDGPDRDGYEAFNKKNSDAYDALRDDASLVEKLIRIDVSSHTAFDRNGLPLPVATFFSYMDGEFDEEHYDLGKAAEILLARDDVHVFPKSEGWRDDPNREGRAETVAQAISRIPGYNAGEGRTQTIHFAYRPSVEDYRRVWDKAASYGGKAPGTNRRRAIEDLDMLGLKAGGAIRS